MLIVGGEVRGKDVASAEIYDPATGRFSPTGSPAVARSQHTATLLDDGRVLIAGGSGDATAEIYDPATGSFSSAGSMRVSRSGHTATLLKNGRVLIAGGDLNGTAELYDAARNLFFPTGSLVVPRSWHTANLLTSGLVLMAGGYREGWDDQADPPRYREWVTNSAELYDPATGSFKGTGSMKRTRYYQAAVGLKSGKVLIAGGCSFQCGSLWSAAELYNPKTGTFSATGTMVHNRSSAATVLLPDGWALIAGGSGRDGGWVILGTAEIYDPVRGKFHTTDSMGWARAGLAATLLQDGRVLITGGVDPDPYGRHVDTALLYGFVN